jgi:hypothetical protein
MANGSTKNIEEIQVGDSIQAYNLSTKEYCDAQANEVVTGYTTRLAQILLENGLLIVMAEGHPLVTTEGRKSLTQKDGLPLLTESDKLI